MEPATEPRLTQEIRLEVLEMFTRPGIHLIDTALPDGPIDPARSHDPIDLAFTGPASRLYIECGDLVMARNFSGKVIDMDGDVYVRGHVEGMPDIEMTGWFPVAGLQRVSESCWRYEA